MIQADLYCLNYDGNAEDCALLALIGSLKDLIIPSTKLIKNELTGKNDIKIDKNTIKTGKKMKWAIIPLSFTIGIKFLRLKHDENNISTDDQMDIVDNNDIKYKII